MVIPRSGIEGPSLRAVLNNPIDFCEGILTLQVTGLKSDQSLEGPPTSLSIPKVIRSHTAYLLSRPCVRISLGTKRIIYLFRVRDLVLRS